MDVEIATGTLFFTGLRGLGRIKEETDTCLLSSNCLFVRLIGLFNC